MGCAASNAAAFDAADLFRVSVTNEPIPDRYDSLGNAAL